MTPHRRSPNVLYLGDVLSVIPSAGLRRRNDPPTIGFRVPAKVTHLGAKLVTLESPYADCPVRLPYGSLS